MEPLRVMSFNIRADFNYGTAGDGPNAWLSSKGLHRRDRVVRVIQQFRPDLLAVQEALAHQAVALDEALVGFARYGVGRDDGRTKGEQCAIYYRDERFDSLRSGTFWLSESPEKPGTLFADAACTRIASWVVLRDKLPGRSLFVLNTHWDHVSQAAREFSARLIRKRLQGFDLSLPLIILGDLNCTEDTEAYGILTGDAAERVLLDSYRTHLPLRRDDEATFHGFRRRRKGSRVDYILHSRDFQTTKSEIRRDTAAEGPASDHYAVTAVLDCK